MEKNAESIIKSRIEWELEDTNKMLKTQYENHMKREIILEF